MAQVTGGQLRASLQALALLIQMAESEFEASLKAFPGEEKNPLAAMDNLLALEDKMVRLQVAQAIYNLSVVVEVLGRKMTLTEAVKSIGPAGRVSKLWRNALPKKERYSYDRGLATRASNEISEAYTISREQIVRRATDAAGLAAAIQTAINVGNTVSLDIPMLTSEDLQF